MRTVVAVVFTVLVHRTASAQPESGWEDISNAGALIYAGIYYPNQGPGNAFDGAGTYYSGTTSSSPHVGLDFGAPRVLRYIEARGTASFSFIGRVRYSDDGVTFIDTATTVSVTAGSSAWHQFAVPDYGPHRYWVIADLQDDAYLQIDEMRWYGPPASAPPTSNLEDVSGVGNYITGGSIYPGQGGSNAFNAPGAWYSGTSSSATYIGRDFGSPRELRRIDTTGTASYSFYGRVRYSDDGITFSDTVTTVFLGPGSSSQQATLIPEVYGAHRYWIIADLQDDAYLQIDEMKLFAVPAGPPPSPGELQDVTNLGVVVSGGGSYPAQGSENAFNAPGLWYSGTSSADTFVGRDLASGRSVRRIDLTGTASFSFYGRMKYSDDGVTWTSTSTTVDVPSSTSTPRSFPIQDYGAHRYWAVFDLQDDAYLQIDEIKLFAAPPPTELSAPTATPAGGVFATAQTVTLSGPAGATIRYTVDGSEPTTVSNEYVGPISINSGTLTLKTRAFQEGLPPSAIRSDTYVIDTIAPTITASRFPAAVANWHDVPTTVSFACADNVGIASCSAPVVFSTEGAGQAYTGSATDLAGRQATVPLTVNLDFTAPLLTLTSPTSSVTTSDTTIQLSADVSDALSGIAAAACNGQSALINAGVASCTVTLRAGVNDVAMTARDAAGNVAAIGVRVRRVGTPTRLTLSPSSRTVLVDQVITFTLSDEFGTVPAGAAWTSSEPQIVSVSTDNPPLLTALQPGTATITATKSGLTAQGVVTVLAGASLPPGTARWSLNTVDHNLVANRVDLAVPDLFAITTWPEGTIVHGIDTNGDVKSVIAAPGNPLMADSFGALVAGTGGSFDIYGSQVSAYVRFGGPDGVLPWRYESRGKLTRPAQSADGTIYAVERYPIGVNNPNGTPVVETQVLVMDGQTGTVRSRYTLPRQIGTNGCGPGAIQSSPLTLGPVVGADGYGYVAFRLWTQVRLSSCPAPVQSQDSGLTLLRVSPSGIVTPTVIYEQHCDKQFNFTDCDRAVEPRELFPDGIGGSLVRARYFRNTDPGSPSYATETRLTRVTTQGVEYHRVVDFDERIMMIGGSGTAFVAGDFVGAMDVLTWTPNWTSTNSTLEPVVGLLDGAAAMHDVATGLLHEVSPSGAIMTSAAFGGRWGHQSALGLWTGVNSSFALQVRTSLALNEDPGSFTILGGIGTGQARPRGRSFATREAAALAALDFLYPTSAASQWEHGGFICQSGGRFVWSRFVTDMDRSSVTYPANLCGTDPRAARLHTHPPTENAEPSSLDITNTNASVGIPSYLKAPIPNSPVFPPIAQRFLKFWHDGSRTAQENICWRTSNIWQPLAGSSLYPGSAAANCATPTP